MHLVIAPHNPYLSAPETGVPASPASGGGDVPAALTEGRAGVWTRPPQGLPLFRGPASPSPGPPPPRSLTFH